MRDANFAPPNGQPAPTPGDTAIRVGRYPADVWGLHDVPGHKFEWCRDGYHARLPGGTDPDLSAQRGEPSLAGCYSRVRRSGAEMDNFAYWRSALRLRYEPERTRRSDRIP